MDILSVEIYLHYVFALMNTQVSHHSLIVSENFRIVYM